MEQDILRVGVNGRTFHVEEPEGGILASMKFVESIAKKHSVDMTVYGNREMNLPQPLRKARQTYYPVSTPLQLYGFLWERTILPQLGKRDAIDLLFCPNGNGPLSHPGYPVVLMIHDVNAQRGHSSTIHQLYRKTTVPRAARVADIIVTVSEFSKREICRFLPVEPEEVRVAPVGISETFLSGSSTPFDLPDSFILFAGGLNPRKNITRLVDAYRKMKSETAVPHKLILVGPPNRAIFHDLEIEEDSDVIHKGFVSEQELCYAYEQATAVAYPSLYEGFGMPPLEAMACGTAVLASDQPPFTETLGGHAELVDPHDEDAIAHGLTRLLTDDPYRRRLEQTGQQHAQRYTWENSGDELYDVFREVV